MKLEYKIAGMMLLGRRYYCSNCRKEVTGFKDKPSAQEFRITRLCQKCQDRIFI